MRSFPLHLILTTLALGLGACMSPGAHSSGAGPDGGPDPALGVATASLDTAGNICSLTPRERQLATWVFVDTGVELVPEDPLADYLVRLTAGAWTETRWIRGTTVIRRWFGGIPVTVRYLNASVGAASQCIWVGTFHY